MKADSRCWGRGVRSLRDVGHSKIIRPCRDYRGCDFQKQGVNLIYGTVRLVERDDESFLPWAKEPYAGVIFNLHMEHTPEGVQHSADAFRRLIDMGSRRGGSYYLTYHRYPTREQVERCYPQFREFLRLKRQYDPAERFQSEWYRHYKAEFA